MPHEYTTPTKAFNVTYNDFTAAANTEIIEIWTCDRDRVEVASAFINVTEAFLGSSHTYAGFEIGTVNSIPCNQLMDTDNTLFSTGVKDLKGTLMFGANLDHAILNVGDKVYGRIRSDHQTNSFVQGAFTVHLRLLQY